MNFNKINSMRNFMAHNKYDSCLIGNKENVIWLTDGLDLTIGQESLTPLCNIFITQDNIYIIATNNEIDQLRERYFDNNIKYIDYPWYKDINDTLVSINNGLRGCSDYEVSGLIFENKLNKMRYVLDENEISTYEKLGKRTEEILYYVCSGIGDNLTEETLSNNIKSELIKNGIEVPVILIVSDEMMKNYRHPKPTKKIIDDIVMIILTVKTKGLYLSLSRIVAIGDIPKDYYKAHIDISKINAELIHNTRPNKTIGEVFDKLKNTYKKHKLEEQWKMHHQGGLTGYKGREIKAYSNILDKIQVNQAYAWNPTIVGGKSEETIIVGTKENYIVSQSSVWPKININIENRVYELSDILVIDRK